MAHGFLSYQEVSGDRFWQNAKWLGKQLDKIRKANIWPLSNKKLVNAHVSELQNLLGSGQQKKMAAAPQTRMLGAAAGGLAEKNPTNIDVKTGERPQSGPRLPASGPSGPSKGGGFANIPGIASAGLNAESFFQKAQTGVGDSGEYLTKAQRIADFRKSQEMRSASAGSPPISGDSGADIVAALNRNTQMIVSLVDAVKEQTKNDSRLTEQQIQTQQTLMLRGAAAQKEAALEQGGDYSGFMTPENFKKKKKQEEKKETGSKLKEFFRGPNPYKQPEGCGCSPILGGPPGGGGGFGGIGVPDFVDQKRKTMGRPSRLGGGASAMRRGGGARGLTRIATKVGGKGAGKAVTKGLGKGLLKKIPGVGVLAGGAFAAERAMQGDWLGAGGELLSGIAGIIPGIGTGISAGIDAGLMARDAGLTPFANGGIVTNPVAGLVGEAGNEGIFPLEGTRGKKTFKLFGEGVFQAQKDNDKDFAKLQSMGLKQYYEREGGFKKMGEGLKDFFAGLGGVFTNIFNSLTGGAANATEFNPAESYLGNAAGGQDLMTLATIAALESGSSQGQADVAQSVYNRLADGTYGKSITDILTRQGQYQVAFKDPTASSGAGTAVADEFKNIKTEDDAVKAMMYYYNKRGQKMTAEQARQKLRGSVSAIQNAELQKKAAQHVGGRTEFLSSGSNVAGAAWRGSGSDNKFFAAYGSGKQMNRGAAAAPTGLFAGASSPTAAGGAGGASALAQAAASMKGMSSSAGPNKGRNACVWAVNKVFAKAGIPTPWGSSEYVPTAEEQMIKAGYMQVSSPQPGDLYVAPGQKHIGVILPDGKVISNSSSGAQFSWVDTIAGYNNSYGGKGKLYRMPQGLARKPANKPAGTPTPTAASPTKPSPRASSASSPGSLQASAASPNTGTPMMAASQEVAMGTMGLTTGGGAPTIINNYYGGGGQQGGVNPNGVSPGIGMDGTGTSMFQELKIRALA